MDSLNRVNSPFDVLLFVLAPVPLGLGIAVVAHMAGIFVERWLFFAEAKHSVTLYYGDAH